MAWRLARNRIGRCSGARRIGRTSRVTSNGDCRRCVSKLDEYERKLSDFDRRLEHEKLESLKELAYGASHEINNPLANIAARAQTLLADETDPERARKLSAIHRQAMRAHEMISDLMLFARPPKLDPAAARPAADCASRRGRAARAGGKNATSSFVAKSAMNRSKCGPTKRNLASQLHAILKNALEAVAAGGNVMSLLVKSKSAPSVWPKSACATTGPAFPTPCGNTCLTRSSAAAKRAAAWVSACRNAGGSSPTTAARWS